jgi:hypothetical protein
MVIRMVIFRNIHHRHKTLSGILAKLLACVFILSVLFLITACTHCPVEADCMQDFPNAAPRQ